MNHLLLFFPLLFLLTGCEPEPPAHPARSLVEAEILPRLKDSASYVFRELHVDTITAAGAIEEQIAIERDRKRQYRQRVLIKAQAYLSAAGTEVSDRELERIGQSMGIPGPNDSLIQHRIDSLMALSPSSDEVNRYVVTLTHTAKDETGRRRGMYWTVIFNPDWQVIEVEKI
jgi:hypothetical protein